MAELVDALDSGSSQGNLVDVRVILAAIPSKIQHKPPIPISPRISEQKVKTGSAALAGSTLTCRQDAQDRKEKLFLILS